MTEFIYLLYPLETCRSQRSRTLRLRPMTVRFQGLRVRISPMTFTSVCLVSFVRYVGRGLFLGPNLHAEDFYRVWFF